MAKVTSNADEVAAWIQAVVDGFDFELDVQGRSLGRDLAGVAAQAMIDRAVADGKDPDGVDYRPNEPKYRARKRRDYQVDQPNVRTGQMLSLTAMVGDTTITSDRVEMVYGTGEPPRTSLSGHITDADQAVTDRQKGEWATDADRRFYELGAEGDDAVRGRIDEALEAYLERESA